MSILHIDFETFSACDLKAEGLARYAADPSTWVHCMAFAFDEDEASALKPGDYANDIAMHVIRGGLVYAHNAAFELAIWNQIMVPRYGWPVLKPEQCRCTMAMCYAMALPGALEAAAPALGIPQRKDGVGKRIMLQVCRPKADGTFWKPSDDPEKFQKLYDYCKQDVEVERALHHRLMELSPSEQALWQLDYKINQQGVLVDLPNIAKAIKLVEAEKLRLNALMLKVTGGVVGSCTEVQLLVKWIKTQGVSMPGVAKADVLDALDGDLPSNVREALELRKEAAKSSTAKYLAMQERASANGRVRGIHQFHGASTGRWAGRGIQLQNYPRYRADTSPKSVREMIDLFDFPKKLDMFFGPTMDALSDCLRGMIIAPPGKDLIAGDFSNVEGRVAAWLAGEEWKLDAFRAFDTILGYDQDGKAIRAGEDIYKLTYSRSFDVPVKKVTKDQRQVGKVEELALGFGGGIGAFQSMAKNYNVKVSDDVADQIKIAWREAHPKIVNFWYQLEDIAIAAVRTGLACATGIKGREIAFRKKGSFLWCKLPSGRVLCYPYPELRTVTTPWGEEKEALTYMTVVSNVKAKIIEDSASSGTWKRISTYGGSLFENVVQATARDLLAEAMKRLDAKGYPIVLHCHDESVVEVDANAKESTLKEVCALMAEVPAWAAGLPLAVEGWREKRYRK